MRLPLLLALSLAPLAGCLPAASATTTAGASGSSSAASSAGSTGRGPGGASVSSNSSVSSGSSASGSAAGGGTTGGGPGGASSASGTASTASGSTSSSSSASGSTGGTSTGGSGSTGAGARSGLGWNSGAATEDASGFETWRGRPFDVTTTWDNRSSWDEIQHPDIYGGISALSGFPGRLALGTAMLPGAGASLASGVSFAACANGDYDAYFQQLGRDIVGLGRGDSYIRLGWEANGDWYAWNADNASSAQEWIACFRHEAQAIRSTAPGVLIDWNMNADTKTPSATHNPADLYPGDDVVDVVGVDFYDNWPALVTDADWNAHYLDSMWGPTGGPKGLGAWLAFAQAHGKPLSVPEWGVVTGDPATCGCGGDAPAWVQHMHDFFAQNAGSIAYEVYFNLGNSPGDTTFLIYPPTNAPNASAAYAQAF